MNKKFRCGLVLSAWALALLATACPRVSRADVLESGTLSFYMVSGGPTPTGSFVWDETTSTWSSFKVSWDGVSYGSQTPIFDLNTLLTLGPVPWCAVAVVDIFTAQCYDAAMVFNGNKWYFASGNFTDQSAEASGGATFMLDSGSPTQGFVVPSPEPGPLTLLAAGLFGLGFATWRRKRRVPPLA